MNFGMQCLIIINKNQLIIVSIPSLDVGGAEKHLIHIFPLLKKRGYNIALYVTNRRGVMCDEILNLGVPVIAPPFCEFFNKLGKLGKPFIYFSSVLKLCFVICKYRPSILR